MIHPEIKNALLVERAKVVRLRPDLDEQQVETLAFGNLWNDCLRDTNAMLGRLAVSPEHYYTVEDYESYLAMEDAMDYFEARKKDPEEL